jgi:hypothetical protein
MVRASSTNVERSNACRILVGKPEGKRTLGRPRRRWPDSIKIDGREMGWSGMDWIDVTEDTEHDNEPSGSHNGDFSRRDQLHEGSRLSILFSVSTALSCC